MLFAEKRFSLVYQKIFEAQFQSYITAFDRSREERFNAISDKLTEIAANEELVAHLEKGSLKPVRQLMEPLLLELGRQRLSSEMEAGRFGRRGSQPPAFPGLNRERPGKGNERGAPPPAPPAERSGEPPLHSPFFVLLDRTGHPIEGSGANIALRGQGLRQETSAFVRPLSLSFADVMTQQQVGYKLVDIPGESRKQVREIFVTPVRSAQEELLGALVFGLPLPTLDERSLYQRTGQLEQGKILSGIWVDGQIVSSTIPEDKLPELSQWIGASLEGRDAAAGHLTVTVDGNRHRVIYRILNPDSPFEQAVQINLYSLEPMDAEISDLRIISIKIGLLAMVVSLGVILVVSRRLSGPIGQLTKATRQIAARNYSHRVPVSTLDEVGLLARSFNDMSADLALQDRYRSVLHAVADPAVAQRLIHDRQMLGGVQTQVTTLFCDIRGFTALSEQLPPPAVVEIINQHMTALTEVAYQQGGTVDKFVGDMIMVLFGAPESSPDDAERAVRCAMAMKQARLRLNEHSPLPLEIGIGIATGTVIAGCMGSEKRLNYTVLGHSVNLAARLCGIAAAGQILIDQATLDLLPASVRAQPQAPVRLKGISEEVICHSVQSAGEATA